MGTGTGGGKSEQNPTTTSTSTNIQETTNNVDNSIHTSDFGAIESAENIARDSIAAGDAASRRSIDLADNITSDITSFAKGVVGSSFDLSRDTADSVSHLANNSLDFADNQVEHSLNFAKGLQDFTLSSVLDLADRNAQSLGSTVKAINDIGTQRNTSADQRVQDLATTALKIGLGMVALIAAVIIFNNRQHRAA